MRDFLLRGTWIKSIKKDVAAEYGLTVEELCGPSQRANVVKARHEAFLRVREETPTLIQSLRGILTARTTPQ
jgi:chromosomal replication initiation ATPase DnaA